MKKNFNAKVLPILGFIAFFCVPIIGCQNNSINDSSVKESAASIKLNATNITIKEGETFQLIADEEDREDEFIYESDDEELASVSSTGLILANNVGKTKIVVYCGEEFGVCRVEVIAAKTRLVNGEEKKLVWSDEFNGQKIDESIWSYQLGVHDDYYEDHGVDYWGNNEKQGYTNKNAKVEDGHLVITAKKEPVEVTRTNGETQTMEFSSTRMVTRNKKVFKYGYIEAKFKTPCIKGMWPAFWMMPEPGSKTYTSNDYGGWPSSGEIDIFEARGSKPKEVLMTLHYGGRNEHKMSGSSMNFVDSTAEKWHTYAINWREDFMEWYIDGVMYHKVTSDTWYSSSAKENNRAPFDKEFYVLFNLAVGGNFDNGTMPPDDFKEASMVVDYLRVFE